MDGAAEDDREQARGVAAVTRWIGVAGAIGTVVALGALGPGIGLAAAGGAVLALLVWAGAAFLGRRVVRTRDATRIAWAMAFVAQSALNLALAAALLWATDPIGVAIGFASLVIGAVLGALETGARQRARGRSSPT